MACTRRKENKKPPPRQLRRHLPRQHFSSENMGRWNPLFITTCLIVYSHSVAVNANSDETDDETKFSYVIGALNGPHNWTNLNPNWTRCGTGRSQSPININIINLTNSSHGELIRKYSPAPAQIKDRGHDIEVVWTGDAGGIIINGTTFKLEQCHWHIPSEHTINSSRFDMEQHIVHISAEKDIAVVSILYKLGPPDPFLTQLAPFISSATSNGTNVGNINPSNIAFNGTKYFRYNGSLTIPPCSENITWTVLEEVRTVSLQQTIALKNAVKDVSTGNARPIQALNERPVYVSKLFT